MASAPAKITGRASDQEVTSTDPFLNVSTTRLVNNDLMVGGPATVQGSSAHFVNGYGLSGIGASARDFC